MPMVGKTTTDPDFEKIRKQLHPRQRLLGWGGSALMALGAVVAISQTEFGSERLQQAIAFGGEPVRAVAQLPPRESSAEAENWRLTAEVRALTADREQLAARVTALEQNLQDITGSIKKQSAELEAARAAIATPFPAVAAPSVASPATRPAIVASAAPQAEPVPANLPPLTPLTPIAAAPAPGLPQAAASATEPVPMPPARIANAPVNPAAAPPAPATIEYGIDLGAATSLEALRVHWAAVKANYGPQLVGLHPVMSHYTRQGGGATYRLIAGPVPTGRRDGTLHALHDPAHRLPPRQIRRHATGRALIAPSGPA
jgi:hypothetical protein